MMLLCSFHRWHGPHQGRLNLKSSRKGVGAWCAEVQDKNQFLQVDLGIMKTVKKLDVQGKVFFIKNPYGRCKPLKECIVFLI